MTTQSDGQILSGAAAESQMQKIEGITFVNFGQRSFRFVIVISDVLSKEFLLGLKLDNSNESV